jgi:deoxyribose-phosphate aldolase
LTGRPVWREVDPMSRREQDPTALAESVLARRLVAHLDLTDLRADLDAGALAARARTPFGPVAGVCVRLAVTAALRPHLTGSRLVTVVNFPGGDLPSSAALDEARAALDGGADELDLVFPWRAYQSGDVLTGPRLVEAVARLAPTKVILETGAWRDTGILLGAARASLAAGAAMLKTATGMRADSVRFDDFALLAAAAVETPGHGVKISGGVDVALATAALLHAESLFGDRLDAMDFRIGASRLLDELLGAPAEGGY